MALGETKQQKSDGKSQWEFNDCRILLTREFLIIREKFIFIPRNSKLETRNEIFKHFQFSIQHFHHRNQQIYEVFQSF